MLNTLRAILQILWHLERFTKDWWPIGSKEATLQPSWTEILGLFTFRPADPPNHCFSFCSGTCTHLDVECSGSVWDRLPGDLPSGSVPLPGWDMLSFRCNWPPQGLFQQQSSVHNGSQNQVSQVRTEQLRRVTQTRMHESNSSPVSWQAGGGSTHRRGALQRVWLQCGPADGVGWTQLRNSRHTGEIWPRLLFWSQRRAAFSWHKGFVTWVNANVDLYL